MNDGCIMTGDNNDRNKYRTVKARHILQKEGADGG